MQLGPLNHIGVATPSIADSIAHWRDVMGATNIGAPFDMPTQGVKVCFVDAPNCQIELIEPLGEVVRVERDEVDDGHRGHLQHLAFLHVPRPASVGRDSLLTQSLGTPSHLSSPPFHAAASPPLGRRVRNRIITMIEPFSTFQAIPLRNAAW